MSAAMLAEKTLVFLRTLGKARLIWHSDLGARLTVATKGAAYEIKITKMADA